MPMLKIKGIKESEILKESKDLIDELEVIIGCPRDYFTIELIKSNFIMDGKKVLAPCMVEVAWFDRGQDIQDKVAKVITKYLKKDNKCLDVIFYKLSENDYYENGEHF
ncbi:DUF1904 family protein [Clostridium tarantellae]|uniref:DUF1904 family protein n=1 Tax=Clostridium tarantellae TaxID=39493 RepID=A0A6I1MP16_9CLOT|nr:DUF1904 family protein [Clostridium tarantellae]MPQ44218.1 DUF1904 family protein [Clostridium tarantellae]